MQERKINIDELNDLEKEEFLEFINLASRLDHAVRVKVNLWMKFKANKEKQDILWDLFKENSFIFLSLCCRAENPNASPKEQLFKPFKAQEQLICKVFDKYNSMVQPPRTTHTIEKSREVGASNTILLCLTHALVFWGHSSIIVSKKAEMADTIGDMGSLLPRIRLAIEHLPVWIMQKATHGNMANYSCPHRIIRLNAATVTAKAANTPDAALACGRGARVRYTLFDEAGFWIGNNLQLAMTAISATANIKWMISSASNQSKHAFNDYVDGTKTRRIQWTDEQIEWLRSMECEPRGNGVFMKAESNPYNTIAKLKEWQREMTTEAYNQEVLGKRGGNNPRIFSYFTEKAYKNSESDTYWTLEDQWIQAQLKDYNNYIFCCWDGGGASNNSACVLGIHINKWNRDILIKEFIDMKTEAGVTLGVEDLSHRVKSFLENNELFRDVSMNMIKHYGDPRLEGQDAQAIKRFFGSRVDMLDKYRGSAGDLAPKFQGIFKNRMIARVNAMRMKLKPGVNCLDDMPSLIIIKGKESESKFGGEPVGCPLLFTGIFEGAYQWKVDSRTGEIQTNREIEQNHPYSDICDAYTYRVLSLEPFGKEN